MWFGVLPFTQPKVKPFLAITCILIFSLFLRNHKKVFGYFPQGLPSPRDFWHAIELDPGTKSIMIRPCRHLRFYMDEI